MEGSDIKSMGAHGRRAGTKAGQSQQSNWSEVRHVGVTWAQKIEYCSSCGIAASEQKLSWKYFGFYLIHKDQCDIKCRTTVSTFLNLMKGLKVHKCEK